MQITICDICGTDKNVRKVWLPYDRRMSAAGSSEEVGKTYDLCCECYLKALQGVIRQEIKAGKIYEYSFNSDLIKVIERRKQKNNQ